MSGPEYDLRCGNTSTSRVLMERSPNGVWKDVATFASYNDAERVLRLISRATDPDLMLFTEWYAQIKQGELIDHVEQLRGLLKRTLDTCLLASDPLAVDINAALEGTGWV